MSDNMKTFGGCGGLNVGHGGGCVGADGFFLALECRHEVVVYLVIVTCEIRCPPDLDPPRWLCFNLSYIHIPTLANRP